eukprot:scaffold15780_cov68-Phaeocystis_antarctica.AAC.1
MCTVARGFSAVSSTVHPFGDLPLGEKSVGRSRGVPAQKESKGRTSCSTRGDRRRVGGRGEAAAPSNAPFLTPHQHCNQFAISDRSERLNGRRCCIRHISSTITHPLISARCHMSRRAHRAARHACLRHACLRRAMPACAMPACAMPACAMPACAMPACAMPACAMPATPPSSHRTSYPSPPPPSLLACATRCDSEAPRLLGPATLPPCDPASRTHGVPSQSPPCTRGGPLSPSPPHAPQSDFPNSQLPRSAPGLRHNMTAPFAPHAVPAALACTCARACT